MKRYILILLIIGLSIPFCGKANDYYTLSEIRTQAALGWEKEYTDNFGRTVKVNVYPEVPVASHAPTLKVEYAKYTPIQVKINKDGYASDSNDLFFAYVLNNPYESIAENDSDEENVLPKSTYLSENEFVELDYPYALYQGNKMTVREAYDCLFGLLEEHDIPKEIFILDKPKSLEVWCKANIETGEVVVPGFLELELWQELCGIPVLAHANQGYKKGADPTYVPSLLFAIRSEEEFFLHVDAIKEAETITKDTPLCSFEEVVENLEGEIVKGHIRDVASVEFGYVLFNDPEYLGNGGTIYADCYYAVPSWVVKCDYTEDPREETTLEAAMRATIIVNAQTGKVQSYLDRSKNGYGNSTYMGVVF